MQLDFAETDKQGRKHSSVKIGDDDCIVFINPKWRLTDEKAPTFVITAKNRVFPQFNGTGATWYFNIKDKIKHEGKYTAVNGLKFTVDIVRSGSGWLFDLTYATEEAVELTSLDLD